MNYADHNEYAEIKRVSEKEYGVYYMLPQVNVSRVGFVLDPHGPRPRVVWALSAIKGLGEKADYYYVHSYRIPYEECDEASGWTEYGQKFVASIEKDNIFGTQFHPEKSQSNGLTLLKNFAELKRKRLNAKE